MHYYVTHYMEIIIFTNLFLVIIGVYFQSLLALFLSICIPQEMDTGSYKINFERTNISSPSY